MLESLRADVSKYKGVISSINLVIISLDEAKSELYKASNLPSYFTIDGSCPDNGEIKDSCSAIQEIINDFNSLISDIKIKIRELEKQIEEELERIKREQEAGLI